MIQITAQMRVLVAIEPVDGRKGIDGLVRLCQDTLAKDPFSGCVSVFRSRGGTTSIRLAIVLLYATGLHRGELFRLTPQDSDRGAHTLLIRAAKFHKSKLLPLPDDLTQEVDRYLQARCQTYPTALETEPLLWSPDRSNHVYTGTWLGNNLRILFDRAGLKTADAGRPRIHDFRQHADFPIMPRCPAGWALAAQPFWIRHNQRLSKKANSVSSG